MTTEEELKKGCNKFLFEDEFEDKEDLFDHDVRCGTHLIRTNKLCLCSECKAELKGIQEGRAEASLKLELAKKLLIRLYGWGSEKGIIEKYNPNFEDTEIEKFLKSFQEKRK